MNSYFPESIAIVGGGFSGALVSVHLLRRAKSPIKISLIEQCDRRFGRGIAYSTKEDCHLLNVRASNMSAFPDRPGQFLEWAKERETQLLNPPWVTEVTETSFLPRRAYGDYLCWLLDKAEQEAVPGVRLERIIDEATGIRVQPGEVVIHTAGGKSICARRAVLALGNFRPRNPEADDPDFYRSDRYHGDPWIPEAFSRVAETQSCLLVGTGLTMVDWAVALVQSGYRGTIHVVSRRGLWPKAHRAGAVPVSDIGALYPHPSTRSLLHEIRNRVRQSDGDSYDWRSVIDSLRPYHQDLWLNLPLPGKRQFLRHIRPFWDCHRHRIAPVVADALNALVRSGQLVRHVGRICGYRESRRGVAVTIRTRGMDKAESVFVDAVVNCSGSESDYRRLDSPLISDLLRQRIGRPDPLRLGLDVDSSGALLDADGFPSSSVFTLGPPKKGVLWETTAVPEIRVQAARLAATLLKSER
jgi:uncharacterized NAD(P)/FAD-binding protein YdhS